MLVYRPVTRAAPRRARRWLSPRSDAGRLFHRRFSPTANSFRRLVVARFPVAPAQAGPPHPRAHLPGRATRPLRALFGSNLNVLAYYYGTDKGSLHDYLRVYSTWLGPLRKRPIHLLEIGVGGYDDPMDGGNSVRLWRTYFPKGRIFAVDLYDKRPHDERRIKTFQGSQDDPAFLNLVADAIGHIDVIIDDGSHINRHVITTFETLFPRLAAGGLYFVEDTQTSYRDTYGGSSRDLACDGTTMNYFRRLVDAPNSRQIAKLKSDYAPSDIERSIAAICFYAELIVILKVA